MSPTPLDHAFAFLVGLVLPAWGAIQQRERRAASAASPRFEPWQKIATYWANAAFLVLLGGGALAVWIRAGRTLHELGLSAAPVRLEWGLPLAALFAVGYAADTRRELSPARISKTRARWRRDTPFLPETGRELRHGLVLVGTAAVAEEVVYRGFLIAYVSAFTGSSPAGLVAAVALPALVFGASHLYQGGRAIAKIVLLGGGFGALAVATRSLWLPILLHFGVDLVGILLAPKLLAEPDAGAPPPLPR